MNPIFTRTASRLGCALIVTLACFASGCRDRRDDRIEARLEDYLRVNDEPNVEVSVHDGVVKLTGTVSSFAQRNEIESAARGMDGVRWVNNNLEVPLPPTLTEAEKLAWTVRKRLAEAGYPQVMVAGLGEGVVLLEGGVERGKRDEVVKLAREASPDVRRVVDSMLLR